MVLVLDQYRWRSKCSAKLEIENYLLIKQKYIVVSIVLSFYQTNLPVYLIRQEDY